MSTYRNLVLAIVLVLSTSAQAQYLDSLYTVWQDQRQPDSIRVAAYTEYIWDGYLDSQPDTVAILAEALHVFAEARNYPGASAKGYNLQGIAYHNQGDYLRALAFYQKCLAINERIGDQKASQAA
jgi:tetratricopeptide (TPR) repeat protein